MTNINDASTGNGDALPSRKIRVMLVDDSAVIRGLIARSLEGAADVEIVGSALNGDMAVKSVKRLAPDVMILDIEMPVMDGLTALPLILKEYPGVKVLICSTLSDRGADVSIRALSLGAAECLLKPTSSSAMVGAAEFQKNLLHLVQVLGAQARAKNMDAEPTRKATVAPTKTPFKLRPAPATALTPRILAIGSSTGGPRALQDLLKDLQDLPVPIVITQHMPRTFTAILAQHIQQNCALPCREGENGMILEAGHAYVAPGGQHMIFHQENDRVKIRLDDGPPENFCKPAVDPMLRSLLPLYGQRILTIILTGMGSDGLKGCTEVIAKGGRVIAQDEASSVVWGMPGAVATAGLCHAVLPVPELAAFTRKTISGEQIDAKRREFTNN